MSRLYEITYNKDQWAIKGSRDSGGYRIVNRETYDSFDVSGDIIGIEQIYDDTFLIYRRIQRYRWQIYRIRVNGNKVIKEYEEDFEHFCFLNDDTILFDGTVLYSIKKNQNTELPILYKNDVSVLETLDKKKILLIEHKFTSTQIANLYDIVIVDAVAFTPITQAFSSLRNQLITLSEDFTFEMLVKEDEYYINVISDILFEENMNIYRFGKETLFSQCPVEAKI